MSAWWDRCLWDCAGFVFFRVARACVLSWVEIYVSSIISQAEARAERAVELAQERVVPAYERL